ncbi:hypothetical protein ACOMHN_030394 [Nucella lapillus]
MQKSIADLCQDVKDTKQGVQQNTEAITRLSTKEDDLRNTVGDLETEIDRLEGFSRRNNIKLFGVPESTEEEQEQKLSGMCWKLTFPRKRGILM